MLFHSPRKKTIPRNHPRLNNIVIELVSEFKYLGIVLDPILSWDRHIVSLEKKVSVLCGSIRKVKSFVSKAALLKYYYACIHSLLQYLNIVWGNACKSKLRRLQVLQNRCLKHIFKLPCLYPTVNLYNNTNHRILPIRGMCHLQTCYIICFWCCILRKYTHQFTHNVKQSAANYTYVTYVKLTYVTSST